jgi:hypothetical protein
VATTDDLSAIPATLQSIFSHQLALEVWFAFLKFLQFLCNLSFSSFLGLNSAFWPFRAQMRPAVFKFSLQSSHGLRLEMTLTFQAWQRKQLPCFQSTSIKLLWMPPHLPCREYLTRSRLLNSRKKAKAN